MTSNTIEIWIKQQEYESLQEEFESSLTHLERMVYQEFYINHLSKQQIGCKHQLSDNMIRAALQRIRRKAKNIHVSTIIVILIVLLDEVTH